ncbi:NAD-dependent deacylase [candidate division WOR-3 bacterium]|nr:NAD-dependent deacylase [candidate division WOR-3 bacterium]
MRSAADILRTSKRTTVFTGAGISVESGIPPFRGKGGLWETYDPFFLDISYFKNNPEKAWKMIIEVFYDKINGKKPNFAHKGLTLLQRKGFIRTIITQNIDSLHQEAGSVNVYEFHGNSKKLLCLDCSKTYDISEVCFEKLPPRCKECGGVLKPDFVFFGEPIPDIALKQSYFEAQESEVFFVIGTSGEIMPASYFPYTAKNQGAKIVELNVEPSNYTNSISDVFIPLKATQGIKSLIEEIGI